MNMCTHNARVWIYGAFLKGGSGFSLIHDCHWGNPHTRCAQLSGHGGGSGGLPRGKIEKKSQMVASGCICGEDIDL